MSNNVRLIDPMDSVSPSKIKNGTPQIEDFFVFAELTAERRSRSVITFNSNTSQTNVENIGNDVNINFVGNNFNKNSNSFNQFSTSWTDATANTEKNEGFGMTSIDVNINSSYIPKVTIEFTDIRGYSFLNQGVNSPYSLLYDFPPPIFKLTLKGFYGKALEYKLHLTKTNTKFESDQGNFIITADFVARTFAPLTDVPFKYVEVFGLLNTSTEEVAEETDGDETIQTNAINLSNRKRPRNTYELIKKIERLYTDIIEIKESSEEQEALDTSRKELNVAKAGLAELNTFRNNLDGEFRNATQIFSINQSTESDFQIKRDFDNINQYNQILLSEGTSSNKENIEDRLCLAIQLNTNNGLLGNNTDTIPLLEGKAQRAELNLTSFFQRYRTSNNENGVIINDNDFDVIDIEYIDEQTNQIIKYKALDITNAYVKIFNFINAKTQEVDRNFGELETKINNSVVETLGMKPTIYNIFEVICDDIDNFFNILRNTAISAERHHEKYKSLIDGNLNIKETRKISAFPLYIKSNTTKCVTSENKSIPKELSDIVKEAGGEPFPEITLVNRFIDAIVKQRLEELAFELRSAKDADGSNKWIPFSPIDSSLINGAYSSPYTDIQNIYPNVDQIQNKLYSKILERFYAISQFSYGLDFYSSEPNIERFGSNKTIKQKDLIIYLAGAEASNVAESLTNEDLIDKMIFNSKLYETNYDRFLDYLEDNIPLSTNINSDVVTINEYDGVFADVRTTDDNINFLYKDRSNEAYSGFKIINDIPELRNKSENDGGIIDTYINANVENNQGFISRIFSNYFDISVGDDLDINKFTTENIVFFTDSSNARNEGRLNTFIKENVGSSIGASQTAVPNVEYFTKYASVPVGVLGNTNEKDRGASNIVLNLTSYFSNYLDDAKKFFNDTEISDRVKAFMLVSLFGTSRGFFSKKIVGGTELNSYFQYPSLIEVPYFALLFMGAMVEIDDDDDDVFSDEIILASAKYSSINVYSNNYENYYDEINFINQLNDLSKTELRAEWEKFTKFTNNRPSSYNSIVNYIKIMLNGVDNEIDIITKYNYFITYLQGRNKKRILEPLAKKYIVANYNQYTFSRTNVDNTEYQSILVTSQNENNKNKNEIFFKEFFKVLKQKLNERKKLVEDITNNLFEGIDDNDITTKLYYSFKNISDKWLSGGSARKGSGYPENKKVGDRLIDKFAFVDRAMNPIGDDCIIGTDGLVEMAKDFDISVFSVFSRLLAQNGFELFPLQNFISFKDSEWDKTFATYQTVDQPAVPAFVCMYIGGTSANFQTNNGFDDDGIKNFQDDVPTDFNGRDCRENDTSSTSDNEKTPKEVIDKQDSAISFPYGEVRAFSVKYSEQNQSFFTGIDLDSREYNETNESLAILSKIAKDESTTVPVPKGQNLFSTYENRAYTAKVTMLGNMMIQPTQYFQLENIPLYSGVYIILDVSHNLNEKNFMTTTFTGVRVLKYPNPIVRNFATRIGIETGTAQDLSARPTRSDVLASPQYEEAKNKAGINTTKTVENSELETWDRDTDDRIKRLHPSFQPIVRRFINGLDRDLNIKVRINSGFRSIPNQIDLIKQFEKGEIQFKPAAPYSSTHNYGLGIDVQYYDQQQNEFILSQNHDRWDEIGGYAEGLGLRWGIDFDDIIHFDMANILSNNEMSKYSSEFNGLTPSNLVGVLANRLKGGDKFGDYVNLT